MIDEIFSVNYRCYNEKGVIHMNTMCENFDANHDDTLGADRPFIFACRDRTARCEERWVLASLSNEEAKKVYEYLQKYFK